MTDMAIGAAPGVASSPDEWAVAFARTLRGCGLAVPISTVIGFAEALGAVGLDRRDDVYWAARATLVRRPEDHRVFDRAFAAFWDGSAPGDAPVDEPEPVTELARLVDLHYLYFTRPDPDTLLDLDAELEREISSGLATLGYEPEAGFADAFARWVGTENFEERDVPGKVDPLVLEHLRRQASAPSVV